MMNSKKLSAVLSASLLAVLVSAASSVSSASEQQQADPSEHKFELAKQYYGECTATDSSEFEKIRPELRAFTDMEIMAQYMSDPARFARLMSVVNDPRTIHVMTKCATEPVMWDTWMKGMTDFSKMSRAMSYFMNPATYMNWMMAPMNPAMYQPMMQMMDPNYYARWSNAMMNPAFYSPMFSLADPNWYTPRINWMMNPQSMQPMFNMMNMGNYFAPVPAAGTTGAEPQN